MSEAPAHPARAPIVTLLRVALAALGTALAVGALELAASLRAQPFGLIPFVTSIALVMGLPEAGASRARAVLGGHVISALAGYAALAALGPGPAPAAIATGVSVAAMLLTRTMHPPAAINPFLIVNDDLGAGFLVGTVVPGALLLAAFAFAWHRIPRVASSLRTRTRPSRAGTTSGPGTVPLRPTASAPRGIGRGDESRG